MTKNDAYRPDASASVAADMTAAVATDDLAMANDLSVSVDDLLPVPVLVDDLGPGECRYPPGTFPTSRNVGSACTGSLVGTCADKLVTAIANCFVPAGCCLHYWSTRPWFTYASGAQLEYDSYFTDYYMNGKYCGTVQHGDGFNNNFVDWSMGLPPQVVSVRADTATHQVTCPDGTTFTYDGDFTCGIPPTGNEGSCANDDPDAGACCVPVPWRPY